MTEGLKHDAEKPRWELLPLATVEDIVKVLTYGAQKYAPNNWQLVTPKERYLAAALRHITAWQSGEPVDAESGLPHLAHALCSIMFLHYLDTEEKQNNSCTIIRALCAKAIKARDVCKNRKRANTPELLRMQRNGKSVFETELWHEIRLAYIAHDNIRQQLKSACRDMPGVSNLIDTEDYETLRDYATKHFCSVEKP